MDKEKIFGIELLRIVATVGVVMNHLGICWISAYGDKATTSEAALFRTINGFAYWPVPIFMMVTGFLLLSKPDMDYKKVFKYFKRIAILVIVFGTLFSMMEIFFESRTISIGLFFNSVINMIEGKSWTHLWYLYMLLGIYLVLPLLSRYYKNSPPNTKTPTLMILIFLFTVLLPFLKVNIGIDFPISSVYVGYLLMGHYLMTENVRKWSAVYLNSVICLLGIFLLFVLVAISFYLDMPVRFSGYTSPFTVVQAALIFILVMRQKTIANRFCNNIIAKNFNRCSLGIYIIHMVWINLFIKALHINIMSWNPIFIITSLFVIVGLSWLTVNVMIKIPVLKNYL